MYGSFHHMWHATFFAWVGIGWIKFLTDSTDDRITAQAQRSSAPANRSPNPTRSLWDPRASDMRPCSRASGRRAIDKLRPHRAPFPVRGPPHLWPCLVFAARAGHHGSAGRSAQHPSRGNVLGPRGPGEEADRGVLALPGPRYHAFLD